MSGVFHRSVLRKLACGRHLRQLHQLGESRDADYRPARLSFHTSQFSASERGSSNRNFGSHHEEALAIAGVVLALLTGAAATQSGLVSVAQADCGNY